MTGLHPFDAAAYRQRLQGKLDNTKVDKAFDKLRTVIQSNKENHVTSNHHSTVDITSYTSTITALQTNNKQLQAQVADLQQQLNTYASNTAAMQSTQQFTLHHVASPVKPAAAVLPAPVIELIINIQPAPSAADRVTETPHKENGHARSQSVSVNTSMIIDDAHEYTSKIAELELDLTRQSQSHAHQLKKQQMALFDASETENQQRSKLLQQVKELTVQLNEVNEKYNMLLQLHPISHSHTASLDSIAEAQLNASLSEISLVDAGEHVPELTLDPVADLVQHISKTPARSTRNQSLGGAALITPSHRLSTAVSLAAQLLTPSADGHITNSKLQQSAYRVTLNASIELEKQLASAATHASPTTPAQRIAKRLRSSVSAMKSRVIGVLGFDTSVTDNGIAVVTEEENVVPLPTSEPEPEPVSLPAPVSSLRTLTAKQGINEIKPHKKILKDITNDWSLRSSALNKIEDICNRTAVISHDSDAWESELKDMQKCMCESIADLRSSIVRDTCKTLLAMADVSPVAFETSISVYLPALYKNLYISIKIISGSCDDCIKGLIQRVNTHRCIPVLMAGCMDTHKEVRTACAHYLAQLMTQYYTSYGTGTDSESVGRRNALEQQLESVCDVVSKCIGDADKDVRQGQRCIFEALYVSYRSHADRLFETFSAAVQKTIESERRTVMKGKAGKRKKNMSSSSMSSVA